MIALHVRKRSRAFVKLRADFIRLEAAAESEGCLDEMTVAMIAEQSVEMAERPELIAHLAGCAKCREQLASVAGLLRDASISTEIGRAMRHTAAPFTRRGWRVAVPVRSPPSPRQQCS